MSTRIRCYSIWTTKEFCDFRFKFSDNMKHDVTDITIVYNKSKDARFPGQFSERSIS